MNALPILRFKKAKILYLVYRASGLEPQEAMDMLPNDEGGTGMSYRTLEGWRQNDAMFKDAELNMLDDPFWCHRNIVLPLKLAALDMHDIEYLLGLAKDRKGNPKEFMGFSSKKEELILQETGLLNAAVAPGAELKDIMKEMGKVLNSVKKPKVIEVVPEEKRELVDLSST